jgi:hypothetical protein
MRTRSIATRVALFPALFLLPPGCAKSGLDQGAAQAPPAFVTIRFAPREGCPGGRFLVDGVAQGSYPVQDHRVAPGRHVLAFESEGDCGGSGTAQIDLAPGEHRTLEPGGVKPPR